MKSEPRPYATLTSAQKNELEEVQKIIETRTNAMLKLIKPPCKLENLLRPLH